jgi:hypothetical protein
MYKCYIEVRCFHHGKARNVTYSVCVCVCARARMCLGGIVTQHAKHMHCIVNCGLSWLYHIFPHYLKTSTIFRKKLLNIKCVKLLSGTFPILRRVQQDIINVHRSSCKVLFILVRF